MQTMPAPARVLLWVVVVTGAAGLALTLSRFLGGGDAGYLLHERRSELAFFLLLGALSGGKKVVLLRVAPSHDAGSMSLSFAVIFTALIRFGPAVAVLIGLVCTAASCLYPRRFPLHQTLFNLGVNAVQTVCAGAVFAALGGGKAVQQVLWTAALPAIVASTLTFFLLNTGLVAAIIGLSGRKPARAIPQIWQETFLWTGPSYFLGAGLSSLTVLLLGEDLMTTLICAAPVTYLTHASYRSYMERTEALLESKGRVADLYLATIRSLALAIDAKDQYTHQHILRVQRYAVATARQMGITGDEMMGLETAALLHDIGKLGVPEYVLLKPGPLTDEEFAKIKEHPRIGADILAPVPFPWPVLPGVKHHHERWDGSGYPDGLKGEDIPLQARILAVADVYDALTSNRSYRTALGHQEALEEIRQGISTHFDPDIVQAFLTVIDSVVLEMANDGEGPMAAAVAEAAATKRALTPTAPHLMDASAPEPKEERAAVAARDIQRAGAELWALYEVAQTLSSSIGLQETLDILARKMEAIFPGTACLFLLRGGTENDSKPDVRLRVRVATGVNSDYWGKDSHTRSAHSVSQMVIRQGATYVGPYDPDDLLLSAAPPGLQEWVPLRSALIVPIAYEGEALGTINLYHPHREAFGRHDQELLEMIAERAAMAIYNGLIFDRARSHAVTDPLTGLANVRYLTEYLERRLPGKETAEDMANARPFALLCLDLDSFKPINDNFGHQKGDQVLCDVAQVLRRTLSPGDVVARYGGDEFLIVVEEANRVEAQAVARCIQEAVARYDPDLCHHCLGRVRLGTSIGAACFPEDGADAATLLSIADSRMYHQKAERKLERLIDDSTNTEVAPPSHITGGKSSVFPSRRWETTGYLPSPTPTGLRSLKTDKEIQL